MTVPWVLSSWALGEELSISLFLLSLSTFIFYFHFLLSFSSFPFYFHFQLSFSTFNFHFLLSFSTFYLHFLLSLSFTFCFHFLLSAFTFYFHFLLSLLFIHFLKESSWAITDSIMQTMFRLEMELGELQKAVGQSDLSGNTKILEVCYMFVFFSMQFDLSIG